ncbi:unnamed protein product [Ilex paraguariensis]|uniref:Protein FAR1-RELATED SEQUENCE n=1 Tax=Ilex paraguariensis TaxID=185542 RepID=A0ABC8S1Z6_9AQUA
MKAYRVVTSRKEDPVYHLVLDVFENKAVFSCKMFEFVGILCMHVLAVFVKKSLVDNLPQKYVLRRWTIFAKDQASHDEKQFDVKQENTQISSTLMGNNLMVEFLRVLEEGQNSKRKHDHLALSLQKLHSELLAMDDER